MARIIACRHYPRTARKIIPLIFRFLEQDYTFTPFRTRFCMFVLTTRF